MTLFRVVVVSLAAASLTSPADAQSVAEIVDYGSMYPGVAVERRSTASGPVQNLSPDGGHHSLSATGAGDGHVGGGPSDCILLYGSGPALYDFSAYIDVGCVADALAEPDRTAPAGRGRATPPSPAVLARVAADRAIALAPRPQLRVTPGRVGLTGLESYFWLGNRLRPIRATAAAGGVTVTAEATPVEYQWDFGDGDGEVTSHPGRRWTRRRPGSIDHVYERRGRYDVRVVVVWVARWRVGEGPWQPLGYFTNSDGRRYPVRQAVAVLTPTEH